MQIKSYTNPKYLRNTGNTTRVRKRKIYCVALQDVLSRPTYIYNVLVTETQTRKQTDDWQLYSAMQPQ